MDARKEAAQLIQESNDLNKEPIRLLLLAIIRVLGAIDEEIVKLRKELRTRNGGEND